MLYDGDDEGAECKKLRFLADSCDGISCVRNVIEVTDKVTAVTVAAQTFTSAESRVSKTISPRPIYVPQVDYLLILLSRKELEAKSKKPQ